jgi:hypothetical protein
LTSKSQPSSAWTGPKLLVTLRATTTGSGDKMRVCKHRSARAKMRPRQAFSDPSGWLGHANDLRLIDPKIRPERKLQMDENRSAELNRGFVSATDRIVAGHFWPRWRASPWLSECRALVSPVPVQR